LASAEGEVIIFVQETQLSSLRTSEEKPCETPSAISSPSFDKNMFEISSNPRPNFFLAI
jgi:hypothetical protein